MNDTISVIVPVYNVSGYLDKCLECLTSQTYDDIEIILINDGSTDNSSEICHKWADKDNRVKVIDKENGGVSSARNAGLSAAKGSYIGFIDPDDWIEPDMYTYMIDKLKETGARAAFCNFTNHFPDRIRVEINREEELVVDTSEAIEYCLKSPKRGGGYFSSIWNKVFCREVVFPDGKPILFKKGLTIGEDELWLLQVCNSDFSVFLTSKSFYNYLQREGSALSKRDERNLSKQSLDSVYAKECIYSYAKKHNMADSILELTKERLFYFTYLKYKNLYKILPDDETKRFKRNMRVGKKAFMNSENFSKLCKIKLSASLILIKLNAPNKVVDFVDSISLK